METKTRLILRHKETGLYYSETATHTSNLFKAKRFPDQEYIDIWMVNANYAPARPEEYETVPVTMTIEVNEYVQEERIDQRNCDSISQV